MNSVSPHSRHAAASAASLVPLGIAAAVALLPCGEACADQVSPQHAVRSGGSRQTPPPAAGAVPRPSLRPAVTAAPPKTIRPNTLLPTEYMPVSELRAGMTGYGLTVFRGNKIDRFDVTILGVIKKFNNGRDYVLVRLGGPNMRRLTGIAHGMSGSPVYVNGRLVGAVSMGDQFTREPIGYVTPIDSMLDAWDPAIPQYHEATAAAGARLDAPVSVEGKRYARVALIPPGTAGAALLASLPKDTLPLHPSPATLVSVSGVSVNGPHFRRIADTLSQLGLEAEAGGGSSSMESPGIKGSALTPGGCIGMSLMTGDMNLTATGTVTYRRGNRLLAFGHPFTGFGPLAAPMYTAYVHDMEPSYISSSMIASPVDLVGSFSQDRPFSVAGTIGAPPAMVPITIHVNDRTMGSDRIFRAQIIRHPQITPMLAGMAASSAINEVHGQPGDAMATVTTTVVADEVGSVTRTNRVYDSDSIDSAATTDLQALTSLLSANAFYPVMIRSIKMDVTIDPGRRTAQVERIFLRQTRFEPGDTVEVGVVLKPYKQDRIVKTLHLRIPATTAPGTLMLTVQGGAGSGGIRFGGVLIMPSGNGDYADASTVKQLATRWEQKDRNDALVARLALPSAAISVQGEKLTDLPPNIETALRGGNGGGRSSAVRLERDEVKQSESTDYVLSGVQSLPIRVAKRGPSGSFDGSGSAPGGSTAPAPGAPGVLSPGSTPVSEAAMPTEKSPLASVRDRKAAQPEPAPLDSSDDTMPSDSGTTGVTVIHVRTGPAAMSPASLSPAIPAPTASPYPANGAGDGPHLVGRAPGLWRHASAADFRSGTLEGVTVTSLGDVRLAPRLAKVAESVEPYFWSLASAGDTGGVYAGSGDGGIIYRADSVGKLTPWAQTGELEVQSLIRAPDGTIYAGTAPRGRLFRIGSAGGKSVLVKELAEKYVLALALSPDGATLYAATGGGSGKVYAIPTGGSGSPVVAYSGGGEDSMTALAVGPDGAVYAGTAPNGRVVKIAGPGVDRPVVLYDTSEPSISGLAVGKDGLVFAAASPHGIIYRINPAEGTARPVYGPSPVGGGALTNLQIGADGTLYTASGSTVIALEQNGTDIRTFDAASDIQILSVLLAPGGGLWISTGNTAGLYRLDLDGSSSAQGALISPVLDAHATARWGAVRWNAGLPSGSSLYLQTRSGDVADPDSSNVEWSDWSRPYSAASGDQIASPPGRYLQYRATLKSGTTGGASAVSSPTLRAVELFYQTPNQPPTVTLLQPHGGEAWRGAKVARWIGSDPDHDTLQYEASVSPDGGKTWLPLRGSVATARRGETTTPIAAGSTVMAPAQAVDLSAELARHPEITSEMRARILADAPPPSAPPAQPSVNVAAVSSPSAATRESSLPFDTTAVPDGVYLLRVTASDRPSNPAGALTAEKMSGEFRIVNHLPTLVLFRSSIAVLADKTARIEGIALHPDSGVAIKGVQYRVDGGEWMAAMAQDGIFDSDSEPFTLITQPMSAGVHALEVQAQDEAGNFATQKASVTIK